MDKKKKKDLKDAMSQDRRRGRKPIDLEAHRKQQDNLKGMRQYLRIGTEEEFIKAMRAFGLQEGSPEFSAALEAWRTFRE